MYILFCCAFCLCCLLLALRLINPCVFVCRVLFNVFCVVFGGVCVFMFYIVCGFVFFETTKTQTLGGKGGPRFAFRACARVFMVLLLCVCFL